MADEIDEVDRQILEVMQNDGRLPVAQIAERVGLSRPAVSERIEKLQRSGIIRGTTTVVAPHAVGRTLTAFVTARRREPDDPQFLAALRQIMDHEDVLELHTIAGDDCYLIKIRTDVIATLNGFINWLQQPPLSMTTRTTIVMETHCEKVGRIHLHGGAHAQG